MSDAPETQEVLTPVTAVTGPLFSLRAYARHRSVSATAVHRAIESGRLSKCVVRHVDGKFRGITDLQLADREWAATTDLTKAPMSVILKTEELQQQQPAAAPVVEQPAGPGGDQPVATDPETLSLSTATAREKHWKAKTAELEYKERNGELVNARELEARIVDEYSRVRTKMLGVPRKAKAQLPHLTREDVAVIDALIREALQDVSSPDDQGTPTP